MKRSSTISMRMPGFLVALAAASVCLVAGAQAAGSGWSAAQIGEPGFSALAINDAGVVAGGVGVAPNYQAAVVRDGTTILLATPENTIGSLAVGINRHGQAVGFVEIQTDQGSQQEAVLWDSNGAVTQLGVLPGGAFSVGQDINDSGQVVGVAGIEGHYVGFLWDGGGPIQALPMPSGMTSAFAVAINNLGQIVGSASAMFQPGRAVLWENGSATLLDSLAEGVGASAADINDSGQIVGTSAPGLLPPHAVLWNDGQVTSLGSLGGIIASAQSINNLGQVVGLMTDPAFLFHAFVWEDAVLTPLPPLAGDSEAAAFDINGLGQVVGWSRIPGPSTTAVVWAGEKSASEMLADLIALVDSYKLDKLGTSLHDKLVNVQTFLAANKPQRACNVLDRFIAQVKEQRGKRISVEQADRLTLDAHRIRAVIGC